MLKKNKSPLKKIIYLFFTLNLYILPVFAESSDEKIQKLEQKLQQMALELQALKVAIQKTRPAKIIEIKEENTERIVELETTVEDLSEQLGSRAVVNAFDAKRLDIGGFLHSTLTHVSGENGSATAFNRQIFELLLKAQLTDNWSAFIAQGFIRQSKVLYDDDKNGLYGASERFNPTFSISNATPLIIAWGNYNYSDALNIQFGRFSTPHGIINIEHFPATLLDSEQPQFLRPFSGQTIFPNFVDGLHAYGTHYFDENEDSVAYNAYVSQIVTNLDDFVSGFRLAYTRAAINTSIGLNYARGERVENQNSTYQLYGVDLLIDQGALLWKSEIFTTEDELGDNRLAYYTQPAWRLSPQLTLFYRYDFLDNGQRLGDSVENTIGLNYLPYPNIRLRGTVTHHHVEKTSLLDSANSLIYQLSATLSF